jgi:hypothetical protein
MGVTILAVLAAIGGVLGLCGSLTIIGLGGVLGGLAAGVGAPVADAAVLGGLTVIFGVLSLVLAVLYLIFAYGAWTLKPWAWILGIAGAILSLVLSLLNVLQGAGIGSQLISILIAGVIIYYLNTPDVKRAFGRA